MTLPPDLLQALQRLKDGTHTPADVETIRRTLRQGHITIATGQRAVALGGSADSAVIVTGEHAVALGASADGAVIVTGDNNIVLVLRAPQRRDLERLLAQKTFNVPPLPEHYLPREADLQPLRQALLEEGPTALGIIGVQGMGGIGKSVLAAALAHDLTVQAAFPDGIIWLPIGRTPDLTARQEDLYYFLTGEREHFRHLRLRGLHPQGLGPAERRLAVALLERCPHPFPGPLPRWAHAGLWGLPGAGVDF